MTDREVDLIVAEQNKSTEEILKTVEKVKSDIQESCNLKEERIEQLEKENTELKSQIEKMKCDMLSLVKDRMNDDIDQNIIERLAEKWRIKEK